MLKLGKIERRTVSKNKARFRYGTRRSNVFPVKQITAREFLRLQRLYGAEMRTVSGLIAVLNRENAKDE